MKWQQIYHVIEQNYGFTNFYYNKGNNANKRQKYYLQEIIILTWTSL